MISRLATIGLVCAGLYAATLGAGAFAQDEAAPSQPTPVAPGADPTATPGADASPTATPGKQRKRAGRPSPANRSQGVAGLGGGCEKGELSGVVLTGKASTSTSGRECVEIAPDESAASGDDDGAGSGPLAGDAP